MKLAQSLIIAIILIFIGLTSWELYWRTKSEYYKAYLEDDRNLWAEERAKIETASSKDIILIGMSRTGYNFNTNIWAETQGIKPINLTVNGKPVKPFFEDIVNNTNFNGTLIVGVTPLGFFDGSFNNEAANQWVKHYYNRTYTQRLGFLLSKPLQRSFVMLSASESKSYNDLDLKSLIKRISIKGDRIKPNNFKLVNIGYNDEDRNLIMFPRMTQDPRYQKEITDQWDLVIPGLPDYSEGIKKMLDKNIKELLSLTKNFKDKGGKIIFIRHKAEEGWNKHTKRMMPRHKVWDKFSKQVDSPTYHFEDHEFMSMHTLPDWSHMNSEDAKLYTKDIVDQLIKDGHLTKYQRSKNN